MSTAEVMAAWRTRETADRWAAEIVGIEHEILVAFGQRRALAFGSASADAVTLALADWLLEHLEALP